MHISIPIANTMEYISNTQISPLISKGVCKVCYVGQTPNRNDTVITKDLALEMGKKLPGSPVVGYFDEDAQDFDGHTRDIIVDNNEFKIIDMTKPYGFVPTDAKVWFQKFDDEGIEHEYLVTEVYIWTGAYPESERIIKQGNNQSMELHKKSQKGFWTNDNKTNARIFIYSEALIEKLCILGQNIEPCFEGAQITNQFSLESSPEFQEFKATMFSMLNELQETLSKGGSQESMDNEKILNPEEQVNFQKKEEEEEKVPQSSEELEGKKKPMPEEEKKEEKNKYNLEEIIEYTELMASYTELQNKYSALQQEKTSLDTEILALRQFKLAAERQSKQAMIDSFYMLSDTDKADVIKHIDTYSLDDIEAKLSIVCVRNKVNFNLDTLENKDTAGPQGLFNLNSVIDNDSAPAWIKAIRETATKQQ